MDKSTHRLEVVRIGELIEHPNAQKLQLVKLFGGGFTVIVRKGEWAPGDLGVYVPPDTLVPLDREEFAWLAETRTPKLVDGKSYHLVRTVRLRGLQSMGLLIKAPKTAILGEDLAGYYRTLHYEPAEPVNTSTAHTYGSQAEPAPSSKPPTYDIDSIRRYSDAFTPGEPVIITEKIHGCNARYAYEDRGFFSKTIRRGSVSIRFGSTVFSWRRGQGFKRTVLPDSARYIRVGSRTQWKRPDVNDVWWKAFLANPGIGRLLSNSPHYVLYGEVYGPTQDLDYGRRDEASFVAFDILDTDSGRYLDYRTFLALAKAHEIPTVPVMAYGVPFSLDMVLEMAEGPSELHMKNVKGLMSDPYGKPHVREGVVVRPVNDRLDPGSPYGRVVLKAVGEGYYERAA